uniref:Uncharacterized protein n=1 Tax=Anguilla anguilla TaxID=7936 RepID=A0A0E9W8D0_ANGAN
MRSFISVLCVLCHCRISWPYVDFLFVDGKKCISLPFTFLNSRWSLHLF